MNAGNRNAKHNGIFLAGILLFLLLLLTACGQSKAENAQAAGEYEIYYLNKTASGLSPSLYKAEKTDPEDLIRELMEQFLKVPNDLDAAAAPEDKVSYMGFKLDNNIVYVYFDSNYSSMKTQRQVLCSAALSKTLTQVSGVEYVSIYSGGQPIKDADGKSVGMLSSNDFIENITNVNSYEKKELVLYFSDDSGKKLEEEKREVIYNMDTSLERTVVEELIKGPQTSGYKASVPADTKLLSISLNDTVCYLNFDRNFLKAMPDVDPELTIYSLVNSLSELKEVRKVQIAVEGSQKVMLCDTLSLDRLFGRNLDYVKETAAQ